MIAAFWWKRLAIRTMTQYAPASPRA